MFQFDQVVIDMIWKGIRETLFMTLMSTLMGYVLGLPLGIALAVTDKGGIHPNRVVYRILDVITNVIRSIPFLILLILVIPVTRFIVGQSYGSAATVVPLVIAAAPFIARMIESSLKEVDKGVIEAAQSMRSRHFHDYRESAFGRGKNILDRRCYYCLGNYSWIFCYGRCSRRRRSG